MHFDPIALRDCTLDDTPTLSLIGAATFLESFAGILEGSSIVAHCQKQHAEEVYRKYLAHPEARAWLAVVPPGDAPVGYALLTEPDLPLEDLSEADIELKRIYLFSRFQRRGIGEALMERAAETARQLGKRRLLLGVHAENAKALSFYGRNGFVKVGVRTFQIGASRYDDLVLGRAL